MVIRREGSYQTGFRYFKGDNEINDDIEIEKLKSYKIPPAYQDVKFILTKKIIAYGFDSKGRKQVIYQPSYIKKQHDKKYKKIASSIKTFEKIKRKIAHDLKKSDGKNKELAIIITLILNCGFRIGNKKYEKENNSFGLTTLKFSHIKFESNKIVIDFIGKKKVRNTAFCKNKYIYDYLYNKYLMTKNANNISSSYVFSYNNKSISSNDVNQYLKSIDSDKKITSKDLRTWNANYLFIKYFDEYKKIARNPIKKAIENVAEKLHNTYSICKKSYIDPKVIKFAETQIKK
jgi:DNA topoisomerase-1